jgi:hypothetical protein
VSIRVFHEFEKYWTFVTKEKRMQVGKTILSLDHCGISRNITFKIVTLIQNMHKVLKELQTMITKTKYY